MSDYWCPNCQMLVGSDVTWIEQRHLTPNGSGCQTPCVEVPAGVANLIASLQQQLALCKGTKIALTRQAMKQQLEIYALQAELDEYLAQPAVTDEQMEAHVYEIACRAAFVAKEQSDPYLVAGQVVEEFKARALQDKANP